MATTQKSTKTSPSGRKTTTPAAKKSAGPAPKKTAKTATAKTAKTGRQADARQADARQEGGCLHPEHSRQAGDGEQADACRQAAADRCCGGPP